MKIPDKTSITLRKASEISMGAKKITHGWQFGIFYLKIVRIKMLKLNFIPVLNHTSIFIIYILNIIINQLLTF